MIKTYYMSDGNVKLSEHFSLHEFQSKNGCDEILVSEELIDALENIYEHFNCSCAIVIDGFREPGAYCRSIGGMDRDAHAYGLAADMLFIGNDNQYIDNRLIACYAQELGLGGIGYMGDTIHLDVRQSGGYRNSHWWGDETNGANVTDWYEYFELIYNDICDFNQISDTTNENDLKNNIADTDTNTHISPAQKEAYVNCAYIELLGRLPDYVGLNNYCNLIPDSATWDDNLACYVDEYIKQSDEYLQYKKRQYIEQLYTILLGRSADENGINTYMAYDRYRDIYWDIYNSDEAHKYNATCKCTE